MAALAALTSVIGPTVAGAYASPGRNLLDPAASAGVGAPLSAHPPNLIVYSEDVPCDPTPVVAGRAKIARPPPLKRIRRRPHVYKAVLAKPSPVVHRAVVQKPILHKVVRRHLHHPRPATMAGVAPSRRCIILHSERLNTSDLAYNGLPETPPALTTPDATPDFGVGGGPDEGGFACGCGGGGGGGGEAFPNPPSGGGGGSGGTPPVKKKPPGPVSAAPEPEAWILMILGLGLCGAALRRALRPVSTAA